MRLLNLHKTKIVILSIITCIALFSRCINTTAEATITNDREETFAGSRKCMNCHSNIYEGFLHTAHNTTSQPANSKTVMGNFTAAHNTLIYSYYGWLAMENTDSGLYQVLVNRNKEAKRYRMDMVIGSGTRGQSYLSWQNDDMLQLPASYFVTANTWVNSPGFSMLAPAFNRIVTTRCVECHVTYIKDSSSIKSISKPDKTQVIYGVQCERCHGAAEKHVLYHEEHLQEKQARFIYNIAGMSRQQKLDLCAYCHGGKRTDDKPAFGYIQGDTLAHPPVANVAVAGEELDVHGNPYGLLAGSKCFTHTETLQCNSCHNTHEEERGDVELFSTRCMQCHTETSQGFCKMKELPLTVLEQNCIDCHMPVKRSKMLTVEKEDEKNIPAILRSHRIAVYPAESKKFVQMLRERGK